MKMESEKLSRVSESDSGKLTFGPAWLRQLSSGDSNKTQLPPSPGLTFQLSKHRYSREEMLAIYEAIENALKLPKNLEEFDDLFRKDKQKPVLLIPPSLEEQKCLSTCVNSLAVLNSYNKTQAPISSTSSNTRGNTSGGGNTTSNMNSSNNRGGSNLGGSRNSGSNMKSGMNSGAMGRGRGRSRGTDNQYGKNDDNDTNISTSGGGTLSTNSGRGGSGNKSYSKSNYSRPLNWDERDPVNSSSTGSNNNKKDYNRSSNEDSWRKHTNKGDGNYADGGGGVDDEENESWQNTKTDSIGSDKGTSGIGTSSKGNNEWRSRGTSNERNTREWSKNKYQSTTTNSSTGNENSRTRKMSIDGKRNLSNNERDPEWLDDDGAEDGMTFDETGQFVSVKKLAEQKDETVKTTKLNENNSSKPNQNDDKEKTTEKESIPEKSRETIENTQLNTTSPTGSVTSPSSNTTITSNNGQIEHANNHTIPSQNQQQIITEKTNINEQQQNILQNQNKMLLNTDDILPNAHLLNNPLLNTIPTLIPSTTTTATILQQPTIENLDPKLGAVPLNHPDAEKWLYLDPQNQIQGMFTSDEMAGWFAAGYFTLNLMVRRGCDEHFLPLGMASKTWGRIPFTPGPQPPPLKSKDQLALQMLQYLQQLQMIPQNVYQRPADLLQPNIDVTQAALNNLKDQIPLHALVQQSLAEQQATQQEYLNRLLLTNNLKQAAVIQAAITKQEQPQVHQQQKQSMNLQVNDLCADPAILSAAPSTQSIWGDLHVNKIPYATNVQLNQQPTTTTTTTTNLSHLREDMINSITNSSLMNAANTSNSIFQLQNGFNNNANTNTNQILNENINDKIQAFFKQTKKEEERRRKQDEELRIKMLRDQEEEEAKRKLEELRIKEEEEAIMKRMAEERLKEELRREEQRRRLEEIIRKQEEDKNKKIDEEIKRKKDEENKQKLENLKRKEEMRRQELEKQRQKEELEKKRLAEKQQQENLLRKQIEIEKQKQKAQELSNLQLPAHANWAKSQQSPNNPYLIPLQEIVEQQTVESIEKQRQLYEQHQKKQTELAVQSQQNTWSSLFRGTQAPSLTEIQNEQASIEQVKQQQNKNAPKPQSTTATATTTWAAWGNSGNQPQTTQNDLNFPLPTTNLNLTTSSTQATTNTNNSNSPFWNESNEKKPQQQNNSKNNTRSQNTTSASTIPKSTSQVQQKPITNKNTKDEESSKNMFRSTALISDEFMKWCHEQLKDFNADLHIPTFVQFLFEIESQQEIEEYVCTYLCDSNNAKEFAHDFYMNRENQFDKKNAKTDEYKTLSTRNNNNNTSNINLSSSNQISYAEAHAALRKKQKKKGQPVNLQLLGFTVQPDSNLTNRGGIDQI